MLVQEATAQTAAQIGAPPIGTGSRLSGAPRGAAEVPPVAKVRDERSDEKKSRGQEIEIQNQFGGEKTSRARLSFDPDKHRVFVEIVDPKTGDVITRFPPEQITNHIDSVLEQTDRATNLEDAGLIVDQSV